MPAGPIRSPSQGGCRAAAGPTGEVAAGPEAREQHGRGAVPGAAAAVSRQGDRQTDTRVGQREKARRNRTLHNKHEADQLNPT